MKPVILNSQGKPYEFNDREKRIIQINQKQANALGYEIDMTSLTTIKAKVSEQKFFEIKPSEYMPIAVGDGAWSTNLTTYRSFALGDDFENGIVNTGGDGDRMASADAGVDSIQVPVKNWAKKLTYSLFDLQFASKSGNWDLVSAKEKSRKRNWDLGIQKCAFLGLSTNTAIKGLLNMTGVTNNTSIITKKISTMTTTELKAFVAAVYEAYRANCNRTAKPTHFIIPESDFNGLASQASPDFPIKSTKVLLEEAFKEITMNQNFKILPLAYGDVAHNNLSVTRYVLLNYDEESLRMDLPVDYTNTLANSLDNFNFYNVGYGQFTGANAYRPLEVLYFSF